MDKRLKLAHASMKDAKELLRKAEVASDLKMTNGYIDAGEQALRDVLKKVSDATLEGISDGDLTKEQAAKHFKTMKEIKEILSNGRDRVKADI